jgi:hypothetical protein
MKLIIDIIVAFLIKIKEKKTNGEYSIRKIIEKLDLSSIPFEEQFDLVKYMEDLGIITANYVLGDAFIKLTMKGIIEFQKKSIDEQSKLFSELANLEFETKLNEIVKEFSATSLDESKKVIIEFIDKLLDEDIPLLTLKDWNTESYKADLEILRIEVNKKSPDKDIIESKLYSLMDCIPLRHKIKELKSMFNLDK